MERYNLIEKVQDELFALLHDTRDLLQQTDFNSIVHTDRFLEGIKKMVKACNLQTQLEDAQIYFPMVNWQPWVFEPLNEKHHHIRQKGERILRLITVFYKLYSGKERRRVLAQIKNASTEYMDMVKAHMEDENRLLNPVLWKYNNDYDLKAITKIIQNGVASCLKDCETVKTEEKLTAPVPRNPAQGFEIIDHLH